MTDNPAADLDTDVAAARDWVASVGSVPLTGAADVLVDGSGRLGPLSYLVPSHLAVAPGDAVQVPFGKRTAHGLVLGPGDDDKATREIETVWGRRAEPSVLATARLIADRHFETIDRVAKRLGPASGKGETPLGDDEVIAAETLSPLPGLDLPDSGTPWRRFVARPPAHDQAKHAAAVAHELSDRGQVLVICPTKALVGQVEAQFESGARRIDTGAESGTWRGFVEGKVAIGIGTRAAALYSAPDLAAIVVVEQSHPALLEASMPHTHARDVVLLRSMVCDVPVVFTGVVPTPSALAGGVKLVTATPGVGWPEMVLVDTAEREGRNRLTPSEVTAAARDARAAGKPALVVVERKRSIHRCVSCHVERSCPHCPSASVCSHTPGPCADCGARGTRVVGWDAARLERLFGHRVIAVEPGDLVRRRNAGTVILFDVDAPARRPGLQPDHAVASLVTSAALAAGPAGKVVAMTTTSHSPTLEALFVARDTRALAKVLWFRAKQFKLPPFGRLVSVTVKRKYTPSVTGWPGTVHGPRKVRGDEWEILVRIPADELDRLTGPIERLRRGGKTRITVT